MLGSGKALKASGDENWCALVNSARERDLIVKPPSASGRGDCTVADVKAFVAKITGKYDADDLRCVLTNVFHPSPGFNI